MPLTASQIIDQACDMAKVPGMRVKAGRELNLILATLCRTYDLASNRALHTFTFNGPTKNANGSYNLPDDWLRLDPDDAFYLDNSFSRTLTHITLAEYGRISTTSSILGYPSFISTDTTPSPPLLYVYPLPSGGQTVNLRYYRSITDITTPENSSVVPWFPEQRYLVTQLAGLLMQTSDDTRAGQFLSNARPELNGGFPGAGWVLHQYLQSQDDRRGLPHVVELDPQTFRPGQSGLNLRATKATVY